MSGTASRQSYTGAVPLRFSPAVGVLLATLVLTACQAPRPGEPLPSPTAASAGSCPPGDLLIETLPSDEPLLDAQAVDYSATCQNRARLTVTSARDGGTMSFVNGLVHIAAADTPLDADQERQATVRCLQNPAWHLPVSADPIALVYHLDGVEKLALPPGTLAKIFSGVITNWNDPEIVAVNPAATLPNARIEVFFRAGRSGATQAVGDYLNRQAPAAWPVGGTPAWRGGGQARGSAQELFDAVRNTPNSIGYVEWSQLPRTVSSPTPAPTATPSPSTPSAAPPTASSPTAPSPTASSPTGPSPTSSSRTGEATPTGPATVRLLTLAQDAGPLELASESARRGVDDLHAPAEGNDLVLQAAGSSDGWPIARVSYQILCSAGQRADLAPLERDWVTYLVADGTQSDLQGRVALSPELRDRVRAAAEALH